jgi:hypothetical protein
MANLLEISPISVLSTDTGEFNNDSLTKDTTPTFTGTATPGAKIKLFEAGVLIGSTVADINGAFNVTAKALADGWHTVSIQASDKAGNIAWSGVMPFNIDTVKPDAPTGITLLNDNGNSSTDHVTSNNLLVFSGQAEYASAINIYEGGKLIGTNLGLTSSGGWYAELETALSAGTHNLTFRTVDLAGNLSATATAFKVVIDNSEAAPTALNLAASSDLGKSSTDNLTGDTAPLINGKAAAGATITLYDNGVGVGMTSADAAGLWSMTPSVQGDGAHHLSATATDQFGNVSALSKELLITLDATAPVISNVPVLDAKSDTGVFLNNGLLTKLVRPTLTGTSEAGNVINLFDGETLVGRTTAKPDGSWSITSSTLTNGDHALSFTAADAAGNVSTSSVRTITVDSIRAAAPTALVLMNDNGTSSTDHVTGFTQPLIYGKAEANSVISLYEGGKLLGTTTTSGEGNFGIAPDQQLGYGKHSLTVTATDWAGNISTASAALKFVVDPTIVDQVLVGTTGANLLTVENQRGGNVDVWNFNAAEGDQLALQHNYNDLNLTSVADVLSHSKVVGANLVLDFGPGHAITLMGVATLDPGAVVLIA